jgi:hypothetical protein
MTPYIVDIERAAASGEWRRIVAVMTSQMGKTEMMLDLAGQRLDQRPAPILYVGPEAPPLMAKVARGKRMTKTRKVVAGVPFRLAHAGSSAPLKSDPAAPTNMTRCSPACASRATRWAWSSAAAVPSPTSFAW